MGDTEQRSIRDGDIEILNTPSRHSDADLDECFSIDALDGLGKLPPEKSLSIQNGQRHERYLVVWDDERDPQNPQNWSRLYRWWLTWLVGTLTLNATFSSSAPSGVIQQLKDEFHLSTIVTSLLISLFIAGYCVYRPLLWGPLSEAYGRRPVWVISFTCYVAFQLGCALAQSTTQLLVFRFLGGCFAVSPLTTAGGVFADLWDAKTRGKAMAIFTVAPFAGPALGPMVSGFMNVRGLSWRWLFWVLTIFAGVCTLSIYFLLPETYAPVILKQKAQRKRRETGDNQWYAPMEAAQISFSQKATEILFKPWLIFILEPILISLTIYISFLYGCLYLLFEAFPIVYGDNHGLNTGLQGLVFLPLFIGGGINCTLIVFVENPRYEKLVDHYHPNPVPPEERLRPSIVGSLLVTISFFWFAWTSFPSVNVWVPIMAGLPMGLSMIMLFISLLNYIVDVYLQVAATALAANTVVRSLFGAIFPLFASQMYRKLGPQWASTLLGCILLAMIPMPLFFIRFGPAIRAKSRYAPPRR
ncbi:major facilitator superfamily domain-containing protein [Cantharellus anzutake]|uniref:major facilitator superfamily domain-containing protein n=1 Tax=Cantharellus anzutake TaxID=1750568 RepID=UPI0019055DCE|nr:major facilitator superfamily domain-containing protein [Cantharellus anzutake]KAF8342649.1 major facilitator superfamily domain-containing protein [Cantharellus anzutake]